MKEWEVIEGDALTVLRTMQDASVDAVITDPPYGVDFQSNQRVASKKFEKIANDKFPFVWFLWDSYRVMKEGGHLICFHNWKVQEAFRLAIEWAGFTIKGQLVWDKDVHGMGDLKGSFAPQHELAWHAVKGQGCDLYSSVRPTSMLRVPRIATNAYTHPNEKPVPLLRHLVRACVPVGGVVLDPFMGVGSTGVACLQERRRFVGIEIEPHYCKLGRERLDTRQTTMELSA